MATVTTRTATSAYVSLVEAGDILGVHSRTIRRYISEGRLTGYRIGPRLVKVKLADLDSLMRPIATAGR
jgi:excisionase family DNA binding protein